MLLLLDISPPVSNIRVWDAAKIYKGGIRWVGNAAMLNSKPLSKWLRRDTAPQPLQSPPQNSMKDNERTTWQTTVVQWNLQGTIWMNTFFCLISRRYCSFGCPSNLHIGWIIAVEDAHLHDPCLGLDGFDVPSAWD